MQLRRPTVRTYITRIFYRMELEIGMKLVLKLFGHVTWPLFILKDDILSDDIQTDGFRRMNDGSIFARLIPI